MFFLMGLSAFDFAGIFKTVVTKWYYYVALAVFIAALALFSVFKKPPFGLKTTKTQNITYIAVLSALATVANVFDIKISDEFQISLVATVGFIAGYLLGGGKGFAVCFIGDLLGAIVNPHGPYNPVIGIGTGLWGLIPGALFSFFRGNEYLKAVIGFIAGFIVISAGVNVVGFCLMYPTYYTFEALLPTLPLKLLVVAINCAVSCALIPVIKSVFAKRHVTGEESSEDQPYRETDETPEK